MATKTLTAEIDLKVARSHKAYTEAKDIFLIKASRNVGFASEGFLKDVLVAEALSVIINDLSAMVRGDGGAYQRPAVVRTICERLLKDNEQRIIRYCEFEANSTSPIHNLQRVYEAVARCKMVEWLREALEDTRDLEAVCDVCGHTGTFALGQPHCDACEVDHTVVLPVKDTIEFDVCGLCHLPQPDCICE